MSITIATGQKIPLFGVEGQGMDGRGVTTTSGGGGRRGDGDVDYWCLVANGQVWVDGG